ncbi:hypothetical protein K449DRAFT_447327 [Hypoxylon sp. EC38]|nr:hypothetical protein K449DRAFT_447327 [Hypoxylon sp. EC38]
MQDQRGKAHNSRHSRDVARMRGSNVFEADVWTAEEVEIIRRYVEANPSSEQNPEPLLVLLGYENTIIYKSLDFKQDILVPSLLRKIKDVKAKNPALSQSRRERKASADLGTDFTPEEFQPIDEEAANLHSISRAHRGIGNAFQRLIDLLEECRSIFREFSDVVEEPIGGTPFTESNPHCATQDDEDSKDDHSIE